MYYFCVILIAFARYSESYEGNWDYTNLQCRDNEKHPVDWWYIYKPPLEKPRLQGSNFTYILPDTHGRWQMSDVEQEITADSMLQYTLEPLFKAAYKDHIAYLIGNGKTEFGGNSVYWIMAANEVGGFFMGHSIPGFLDINKGNADFPKRELPFGHFVVCLSLDLATLNLLASLLKQVEPKVQMNVPINLRPKLPFWQYFNRRDMQQYMSLETNAIDFQTVTTSLPVHVMVRRPRDKSSLYTQFAKKKKVILDVYEHNSKLQPFCMSFAYGVRKINSISLKIPDQVFYIPIGSDKMGFAVSTAAYWQTKGSAPEQYWACVSTIENEKKSGNGAIMLCVQDYNIWWTFDNLKVKEPKC